MGLLDQVIGGVLGSSGQGGQDGGTSPLVKALMLLLAAKAANSYIHHGGSSAAPSAPAAPQPSSGTIESGMMAGLPSLESLLDKFRSSGHEDKVESWLGNGPNKPVAPGELEQTLGSDTVSQLQNQTGMSRGDLMGQLSQYLPQIIDKLSPGGRLPTPDQRTHW